ncbi:MAG: MgtC/SapB family protein [candidate division Zixibacteria bacterium]|nr:MgtC/SapB family protein [candidate division KSB1 bacterium]NIS48426.1 MgtC/SapB family protein [candidate division Zixibacteria bacterium]NIT72128.1 MgtC/SapB family protein [candidate division KSB1 bacterium]NIU14972.1 MgtC/SapB family protein [candidate division Zixibacteria bacterium]NIV08670.1 MgtC/SapB family protein [candidate division Zixibacteria bacterium]
MEFKILGRVALAMILGALIGLDREFAHKAAGLRTQMFVAGASCLIVGVASMMVNHFDQILVSNVIQSDPIRVIVAVITGISFLGAGTIIRRGDASTVVGLTTAASLLFSAAIGMGVALGQYILSVGATILAIIVLSVLPRLQDWLSTKNKSVKNNKL